MSNLQKTVLMALSVLTVALALNLAIAWKLGLYRPMESDAYYFRDVAENLSVGQGYRQTESFWIDTLTMTRLPGWPFAVALALKAAPGVSPDLVMRLTAICVNSVAALLVALLALRLFRRHMMGVLAGLVYALHPTGIYSTYTGLSEPLFVAVMVGGVLLLLTERFTTNLVGFALVGLSCLVRANYVLWGVSAAAVVLLLVWRKVVPVDRRMLFAGAVGMAITILPTVGWAARNYRVCGHFPVVSTIQGQTFYGGNNQVVATNRQYWGYWVFPDSIPGERPMGVLAKKMSEYEINKYYMARGNEFIRDNLGAMPGLLLGKLVRAFVPVPWNVTIETVAVSVYRWALYLAAIAGMVLLWRNVDIRYRIAFVSMFAVTVVTVLWLWGCARFAFAMEPFLIPFAVGAADRLLHYHRKERLADGRGNELLER